MAKKYTKSEIEGMIKNLKEKEKKARSKWGKAVLQDAQWLLEDVIEGYDEPYELSEKLVLNGAENWNQFSWDGNALVYNGEIAEHYSTPSEAKNFWGLTKDGGVKRDTNTAGEHLLDIQARALRQAWWAIRDEMNGTTEFSMSLCNFSYQDVEGHYAGTENFKKDGLKYRKTKGQVKDSYKGKKSNFSIDYICEETCDLADFPAWSGAKDSLNEIIELGIEDEAEDYIKEMFYGETPTDTQINDLLWFDMDDWIEEHREHKDNFKIFNIEWDESDIEDAKENDIELPTELELEDIEIEDRDDVESSLSDAIYDEVGYSPNSFEYESESGNFSIKKGTKKQYEEYLNEIGEVLSEEEFIIGGKMRNGKYGTMLKKYDPIAFNVGYNEWKQNQFSIIDDTKDVLKATGKLAGNIVKNTTDKGGLLMF